MFLWDLHFVYRLVINPFCYVLYLLSCLTPRAARRMAFGSSQFEFNGNAKYLFIYMNEHFPDLDLAWITTRRAVRDKLRTLGYKAYLRYEPRGLIHCLTARFYVYHGRPTDINYWTSGRVIDVNLWHGVGLKGLGFNSSSPLNRKNFNSRSVLRRFAKPWLFKKPSYFVSTTPLMTDYFAKSFLITAEQCWEYGYSRSDHFFLPADERYRYLQKHEPPEVVEFIDSLAAYSKVYLYMPTYRDNMENFIKKAGIDYARLNEAMVARNALFVFKLHPWTRINLRELARYSNLIVVDSRLDPYTFLPYADVLITDYSSIYYDYLLLDKGIILFPFDYEKYISLNCDLVFDYDEYTPGKRATDFDGLMAAIEEDDVGRTAEQERIKTLFWGEYKGDASKRIAEHIVRLMQE